MKFESGDILIISNSSIVCVKRKKFILHLFSEYIFKESFRGNIQEYCNIDFFFKISYKINKQIIISFIIKTRLWDKIVKSRMSLDVKIYHYFHIFILHGTRQRQLRRDRNINAWSVINEEGRPYFMYKQDYFQEEYMTKRRNEFVFDRSLRYENKKTPRELRRRRYHL